jgi:hypothetical protein
VLLRSARSHNHVGVVNGKGNVRARARESDSDCAGARWVECALANEQQAAPNGSITDKGQLAALLGDFNAILGTRAKTVDTR